MACSLAILPSSTMSQYFRFQLNPQCEKRRYIHEFRSLNTFYLLSILIPPPLPLPVLSSIYSVFRYYILWYVLSTDLLYNTSYVHPGLGQYLQGNNLSNNLLTYSSLKTSDRTSNVITREIIRLTCQGRCKEGWIISAT